MPATISRSSLQRNHLRFGTKAGNIIGIMLLSSPELGATRSHGTQTVLDYFKLGNYYLEYQQPRPRHLQQSGDEND